MFHYKPTNLGWGYSTIGRMLASHARGPRFNSQHHKMTTTTKNPTEFPCGLGALCWSVEENPCFFSHFRPKRDSLEFFPTCLKNQAKGQCLKKLEVICQLFRSLGIDIYLDFLNKNLHLFLNCKGIRCVWEQKYRHPSYFLWDTCYIQ